MKSRRSVPVCLGAVGAAILLNLAATSGSMSLWDTPDTDPRSADAGEASTDLESGRPDSSDEPVDHRAWGDPIAVIAILLGTLFVLWARPGAPRTERLERRVRLGRLGRRDALPLGAEDDSALTVDVRSALAALASGSARNAIVACWMQVERDAAAAGVPRDPSETSAEYSERVVAQFSVDPGPIRELAALYREARFSRHELDEGVRDRAAAAFDAVVNSLQRGTPVAL